MHQPSEPAKQFTVELVAGRYEGEWYNITSRRTVTADPVTMASNGSRHFFPPFDEAGPVVLYLKRVGD